MNHIHTDLHVYEVRQYPHLTPGVTAGQIARSADPHFDEEIEEYRNVFVGVVNWIVFMVCGAVLIWGVAELCLFVRHFGAHVARLMS